MTVFTGFPPRISSFEIREDRFYRYVPTPLEMRWLPR